MTPAGRLLASEATAKSFAFNPFQPKTSYLLKVANDNPVRNRNKNTPFGNPDYSLESMLVNSSKN